MSAPPPVVELQELGQSQNEVHGWGRKLHMPGHPEGQRAGGGAQRKSIQDTAPETWWPGLAVRRCRRLTTRIPRDGYGEVLTPSGHPVAPGLLLPRIGDDVC